MRIINILIFYFILYILKRLFILYKFNDQKKVKDYHNYKEQNLNDYKNIQKQFGPMFVNNTSEFGIFKLHPLSHPNDIDIYLSKITNNLNILDCGSGLLGTEDRILQKFRNNNIHVINKVNKKFKKRILDKINLKKYNNYVTPHFIDFKNIKNRFDEIKFDRILFIESLSFNKNIKDILCNCFNLLKDDGILYIRTTIRPDTKSNFINKNISDIENNIEDNILYHDNIVYFLQKAGFKNIKFSSVPLILSNNFSNIFFTIPLLRYKLFNLKSIFTMLSISQYMYVVSK